MLIDCCIKCVNKEWVSIIALPRKGDRMGLLDTGMCVCVKRYVLIITSLH